MKKLVIAAIGVVCLAGVAIGLTQTPAGRSQLAGMAWRQSLPEQFPDVAATMGLSPDETRDLFKLLAKQQKDLWRVTRELLGPDSRETGTRLQLQGRLVELERANQQELTALLGSRYPLWQQYLSRRLVRQQVETLQSRLAAGTSALREEQVQPLIDALSAEQLRLDLALRAWDTSEAARSAQLLDEHMNRTVANYRQLLQVASSHLDQPQREEYWKVLDQLTMREVVLTQLIGKPGTAPLNPPVTPAARR